jgi:predicted phosphoribosyltransferase
MRFRNRRHAGQALAEVLAPHIQHPAIVYALPRGGVPLGAEIARRFKLPLDLVITRKIGHPLQPEYAIGAVTEKGEPVYNEEERQRINPAWLGTIVKAEREEARRRRELYRGGHARVSARGCCAIIVDDGIATGLTMRAAVEEVRADRPSRLIVAVPVAPEDTARQFAALADRFVAVDTPAYFLGAVGAYYEDFRQVSDQDVVDELSQLPAPAEETRERRAH